MPTAARGHLRLYRSDSDQIVLSDDNSGVDTCSAILPNEEPRARYLEGGDYTVCVAGFQHVPIDGYSLSIQALDDKRLDGRFSMTDEVDLDGDGVANACDRDDDDDGVRDEDDNCPTIPNGSAPESYRTTYTGLISKWMLIGPFHDDEATCPVADEDYLLGEATARPELGDTYGNNNLAARYGELGRLRGLHQPGGQRRGCAGVWRPVGLRS